MGVMTTLLMEYTATTGDLLMNFLNGFRTFFEVAGISRAAAELTRMGMHKEARKLMMEVKEIRGEK
jgi:hypothetical protein